MARASRSLGCAARAVRPIRCSRCIPIPWQIWTADARSGEGRLGLEKPGDAPRLVSDQRGTGESAVDERRPDHLSRRSRWLAAPLLDLRERRRAAPPHAGQVHGGVRRAESRIARISSTTRTRGRVAEDIDRRHIFTVPVDRAQPDERTPGDGLEWAPNVTGDGSTIVFLGGGAKRPPLPAGDAGYGRRTAPARRRPHPVRLPDGPARDAEDGRLPRRGRHDGARAALRARGWGGAEAGSRLRARRPAAADAARLALHGLLHERVRDESVPRQQSATSCWR